MRLWIAMLVVVSVAGLGCGKIKSAVEEAKRAQKEAKKAIEEAKKAKEAAEAAEKSSGKETPAKETGEPEEKGVPVLTEVEVKTVAGLREKDPAFDKAAFNVMEWVFIYAKNPDKYDALLEKEGLDKDSFSRLVGKIFKARFGEQTIGVYDSMKEGYESIDAKKAEAAEKGVSSEDLKKFDEAKADLEKNLEQMKPEVEKARANLELLEKYGLHRE